MRNSEREKRAGSTSMRVQRKYLRAPLKSRVTARRNKAQLYLKSCTISEEGIFLFPSISTWLPGMQLQLHIKSDDLPRDLLLKGEVLELSFSRESGFCVRFTDIATKDRETLKDYIKKHFLSNVQGEEVFLSLYNSIKN